MVLRISNPTIAYGIVIDVRFGKKEKHYIHGPMGDHGSMMEYVVLNIRNGSTMLNSGVSLWTDWHGQAIQGS